MSLSRRRLLELGGVASVSTLGCKVVDRAFFEPLWQRPVGPFATPTHHEVDLPRHLIDRLTFGARPETYGRLLSLAPDPEEAVERWLDQQLAPETIDDSAVDKIVRRLETLDEPTGELFEYQPDLLLRELTTGTILRAVYSQRQIYERMVQFWRDHFNIDSSKGDCKWLATSDDRQVIRRHALGRFPDLLRAVALSPSMLWYLDGRENRTDRGRPNENYARELLELHTLGAHGGYTQQDVMEVARCLSGWSVRSDQAFGKGRVEFHGERHDDGPKVVLGRPIEAGLGAGDLDAVLDIVALHPSTAHHLATKLCRVFIDDHAPESAVSSVAQAFSNSSGDLTATVRELVSRPELRSFRRTKLKRPFHFVVSALRATGAQTDGAAPIAGYLLSMGHVPYQYPTPDGYPAEAGPWHGTLLWRWSFAVALSEGRIPGTRIDSEGWKQDLGGREGAAAHLLGRLPTRIEQASADKKGSTALALILASPGFQLC